MKTIILDTCFILTALKYKIDIVSEIKNLLDENFQLKIIDKTIKELKGKKLENLAKTFLQKNQISKILTTQQKNVDSLILSNLKKSTIVATQDKNLKEKLKKRKMPTITIRQKRYLIII